MEPQQLSSKVMIVSDLHYEKQIFKGVDEEQAFPWLLEMIRANKPGDIVMLGDQGGAWTIEDWNKLASLVRVHAIYGNHDNVKLLEQARNADESPVLARDAEIRVIQGLKFGFINGIISDTRREKQNVPRKTTEEYVKSSNHLRGIDVLCTHLSPYVERYGTKISEVGGPLVVKMIIEKLKPKLAFSGHLSGGYTIGKIGNCNSIRIESSQSEEFYAILQPIGNKVVEIRNNYAIEKTVELG
ncbi:MAG: metallophosphoesterase family protein [Nitrososphaerales archaeon]